MNRANWIATLMGAGLVLAIAAYIGAVYVMAEAKLEARLPELQAQLDEAQAQGTDWKSLSEPARRVLLEVRQPDLRDLEDRPRQTPGAIRGTMAQALAGHIFYATARPDAWTLEQTLLALRLEQEFTPTELLTLYFGQVELGHQGGRWTRGLEDAAQARFSQPARELNEAQAIQLAAVMIAPAELTSEQGRAAYYERVDRITRLVHRECQRASKDDLWLDGCA